MNIWVDADACPVVIKEIIFKAAQRTKISVILIANKNIRIPKSRYIQFKIVPAGPDVADNEIVRNVQPGDLVITADIPLAARIVEQGAKGLNPRGELYSAENISDKLSTRDFMDSLRANGIETGGPPPLTKRDRQLFANALDRTIQSHGQS